MPEGTPNVTLGDADVSPRKLASVKRTLRYVAALYAFLALLCVCIPLLLVLMIASGDMRDADTGMIVFGGVVLLIGSLLMLAAVGLWRQRYRWAVLLVT